MLYGLFHKNALESFLILLLDFKSDCCFYSNDQYLVVGFCVLWTSGGEVLKLFPDYQTDVL